MSTSYAKSVSNPFYSKISKESKAEIEAIECIEEYEPALHEIDSFEKLEDPYFHSDDT